MEIRRGLGALPNKFAAQDQEVAVSTVQEGLYPVSRNPEPS